MRMCSAAAQGAEGAGGRAEGRVETLETGVAPSRPYYLGAGIGASLPAYLARLDADRVFVVADPQAYAFHGPALLEALRAGGPAVTVLPCPRGEAGKTMASLEALCGQLLEGGATKDSVLAGFGGGATGNLVGMAAALLYRGVRFVQMPTTMMAQTDSVLSNKQAVNCAAGKNLLGMFHPPEFVWADTRVLQTEDARQRRSALAEGVKNALIADPAGLAELDGAFAAVIAGEPDAVHGMVRQTVLAKVAILRRDPTERGYAMCLEYGHTFGHALETLGGGSLTHGEAVAIGMVLAARLSHRLGYLDAAGVAAHEHYLGGRLGLAIEVPATLTPADVLRVMRHDNKRTRAGVRFVLLRALGTPVNGEGDCLTPVEERLVEEVLVESWRRTAGR